MLGQTNLIKASCAYLCYQVSQSSSKNFSMSPVSFIVFVIIILSSTLLLRRRKSRRGQLPPGPPGWPIVGNMFQLGSMPHRTLNDLRDKYGEVIWLNFGAKDTMVLLSAKAATDFFKNHDLSFADRNIIEIMRAHDYYRSSLALAPYGSFWRLLRRLVTIDMLVNKRINETVSIRRKCVNDMLIWIEKEASQGNGEGRRSIHVARFVFLSSFNLLGNLMLSRDLLDPNSKDAAEFFASMIGLMEWGGHPNISDFFPFLRWLDPQGLKRKMKRDLGKAMKIASKFVKERVEEMKEGDRVRKDFLDVLLEFEGNGKDEPAKLSDEQLNIFILVILRINHCN